MSCNVNDLHFYAECAKHAYLPEKEGKAEYKNLGFTESKFIDIDGAQVYCVSNKTTVVVCFRGTQPTEFGVVAADLRFWPTEQKQGEGKVHQGFAEEVNKVEAEIAAFLEGKDQKEVIACGHSLGGAMTVIWCARNESVVSKAYTYGCPRVGNKTFVQKATFEHYRCVNNNDIVTRVPPPVFFKHHGEIQYINFQGHYTGIYSKWIDFIDGLKGLWAALKKFEFFDGARDHDIAKYAKYLEQSKEL